MYIGHSWTGMNGKGMTVRFTPYHDVTPESVQEFLRHHSWNLEVGIDSGNTTFTYQDDSGREFRLSITAEADLEYDDDSDEHYANPFLSVSIMVLEPVDKFPTHVRPSFIPL